MQRENEWAEERRGGGRSFRGRGGEEYGQESCQGRVHFHKHIKRFSDKMAKQQHHKLLHENYQLLLRELDREETSKQCQCMLSQPSCTYSLGCPLILTSICITY